MTKSIANILALLFLAACGGEAPKERSPEPASSAIGSSAAVAAAASKPALCEFRIGDGIPAGKAAGRVQEVPTEGDPRIFHEYVACDGSLPILIELEGSTIAQIRVEHAGGCVPDVACVGDAFSAVAARFPTARTFASMIEGALLALLVDDGTAVGFDTNAVPDKCFDTRNECAAEFSNQRVIAISLS